MDKIKVFRFTFLRIMYIFYNYNNKKGSLIRYIVLFTPVSSAPASSRCIL